MGGTGIWVESFAFSAGYSALFLGLCISQVRIIPQAIKALR